MRGAARGWEEEYTHKMRAADFVPGRNAPTVFRHSFRDLRCVVHGDNFTFAGPPQDLMWAAAQMQAWYEVKVRGVLGPEPEDTSEIDNLNQRLVWGDAFIALSAETRHTREIVNGVGLTDESKLSAVSGRRETED